MGKRKVISVLTSKQHVEASTEAALSVVEMERLSDENAKAEQQNREALIAQCHEVIGRVQANTLMTKFGNVASLVYLQQVKDSKIYRDLPSIGTWDKFCEYIGLSRRKVDEDLQNLASFGEDFLATCRQLSVGYKELRKLRKATAEGQLLIEDGAVEIAGERIPLNPDHAEDLQAAIESLVESKDRTIEENQITLRAKDRILKEKEKVIQKQEKDLSKYEKEVAARGYLPGEENFIREMEKQKGYLTAMQLKLDPRNTPANDEFTPLMKAAYIETLGIAVRVFSDYYDYAIEVHGDPKVDGGWTQPGLEDSGQ